MEADRTQIRLFLERVHSPEPDGWLILWTRQDKATQAFDMGEEASLDRAVEYCEAKASAFDVYSAVGLQRDKPANSGRGAESGVSVLPGLWADVDIRGGAHKATALPPTEGDALSLIEGAGLEPGIVVRSGFGFQAYWLFREPYHIENDDERQRLKSLSKRFQRHLRVQANARGWTLDSTADLCRVLRVPGTFNRKIDGDIRLVTADYRDPRYNLSDFEDLVAGIEDADPPNGDAHPAAAFGPAKLPRILNGCAWMRHCREDAAALAEPEWYRMLTVVARCEDAEQWAHDLSRAYPQYSKRETHLKLRQASSDKVAPVTCAYVQSDLNGGRFCAECLFRGNLNSPIALGRIDEADAEPGTKLGAERRAKPEASADPASPVATASRIEKFTDLGNAKRFVARYRGTLVYCEPWGRWFLWDSTRWAEDERLEVVARAGELMRGLYPLAKMFKAEDERNAFLRHLNRSESHRSLTAMVTLAKADQTVARHPGDFDRDPWLFTVKNGTLDLRTGKLRAQNPKDLITRLAPVVFDPLATCPHWLSFLDMIMLGRSNLVHFLKRAFGSSLTGITSDKAMFILYGAGGDNGKSTMVEVFEMVLGDYARRTPVETFLKKREGSIPNDIARLRGARFVWAAENDRGVRLAESLLKEMTGGDRMVARFMRGEFFEFMPAFKIWFATNHKPTIRGDAAIWRRLKLIPFDFTIPKDRQMLRHQVMAMFQVELPGILNWAIEGCLEWQSTGLGVPDEVINATREYEAEQDTFSMFLEERCIRVPNAQALSLALYREYKVWAEAHGEPVVSHKTFASLMSERGFAKTKTMKGALYTGVGLRTEDHCDLPRVQPTAPPLKLARDDEGEEV